MRFGDCSLRAAQQGRQRTIARAFHVVYSSDACIFSKRVTELPSILLVFFSDSSSVCVSSSWLRSISPICLRGRE